MAGENSFDEELAEILDMGVPEDLDLEGDDSDDTGNEDSKETGSADEAGDDDSSTSSGSDDSGDGDGDSDNSGGGKKETGSNEEDPPELSELEQARVREAKLLERIEALEGRVQSQPGLTAPKKDDSKETELPSFLSDDDELDELLGDKKKLEAFALKIYSSAIEDAEKRFSANVMPQISGGVVEQVQTQLTLAKGIEAFFDANQDLLPVRKTVGGITNEIVAEHQDWTLEQVLTEAGKRTREVIGIPVKTASKKKTRKSGSPAFANDQNARKNKGDTRTNMQREIDALL